MGFPSPARVDKSNSPRKIISVAHEPDHVQAAHKELPLSAQNCLCHILMLFLKRYGIYRYWY
jgi:hypothetical protein